MMSINMINHNLYSLPNKLNIEICLSGPTHLYCPIFSHKGAFINTLVGGLGKVEGGQKSFESPEGGDQKVFRSKGGVKKV